MEKNEEMLIEGKEIMKIERKREVEKIGSREEKLERSIERMEKDEKREVIIDDERILGWDKLWSIEEIGLMIDRKRNDERERRIGNEIGGVEKKEKEELNDERIGGMLWKKEEGKGGKYIEKSDVM